jgi:Transposase DDE domain
MLNKTHPSNWASQEFFHCKINDKRLISNLIEFTDCLFKSPSLPISHFSSSKAQQDRFYRLIGNQRVSLDKIMESHKNETLRRCKESNSKEIIVIEDTSLLEAPYVDSWESGILHAKGDKKGFIYHSTLAIDGDNFEPLGVVNNLLWIRPFKINSEQEDSTSRKSRPRESIKWILPQLEIAVDFYKLKIQNKKIIMVADRESDIYENYVNMKILGHSYVFRMCHNRNTDNNGEKSNTYDDIENEPIRFYKKVEIEGNGKRPKEVVQVSVRAKTIEFLPSKTFGTKEKIKVNVVLVKEEHVTLNNPLWWLLVTQEPIETDEQIKRIVEIYESRWIIEEFFKGLKTGCKIEKRKLESSKSFENFLAISIIATWKILSIKIASERKNDTSNNLSKTEIEVLNKITNRRHTQKTPSKEILKTIASMGGYNIYLKTPPGWQTLWRGYERLSVAIQTLQTFGFKEGS